MNGKQDDVHNPTHCYEIVLQKTKQKMYLKSKEHDDLP